jgi:hypothetical protein
VRSENNIVLEVASATRTYKTRTAPIKRNRPADTITKQKLDFDRRKKERLEYVNVNRKMEELKAARES